MTDLVELRKQAEAFIAWEAAGWLSVDPHDTYPTDTWPAYVSPAVVLPLIDEIERLRADAARLRRGECICIKCGLRQDAMSDDDGPAPPALF